MRRDRGHILAMWKIRIAEEEFAALMTRRFSSKKI